MRELGIITLVVLTAAVVLGAAAGDSADASAKGSASQNADGNGSASQRASLQAPASQDTSTSTSVSPESSVKALGSPDAAVRVNASQMLIEAGAPVVVPLLNVMDRNEPIASKMAFETLFRIAQHAAGTNRQEALAAELARELRGKHSVATRREICRLLSFVGDDASLVALYQAMTNADTEEMAKFAITRTPGQAATMALMGALQITEPPLLIGVINDLGERGDARAAPALAPMTESRIPAARQAAMNALAGIPDRVSLAALKRCVERKEPGAVDALLRLGENAGANGRPELAQAVLEEVSGSAELEGPQYCRVARLIVYAEPGTYTTEFLAGLVASYGEMGNRYLGCLLDVLAEMPGTEATKAIAGLLQKERRQVLMGRSAGLTEADLLARLLGVLGWRGVFMTEQAADVMVEALREPDERVRLAAVQAIEQAGVASGVDALVGLLSDGSAAVRDAAEHAICHMNGDEATRRIMAGLEGKPAEVRVKLLSALGYRGSPGLVLPALEKAAGDSDERVRAAALRAIVRTRTKQEPR